MLPFLILAPSVVSLRTFTDDGGTQTAPIMPQIVRLKPAKNGRSGSIRVGSKGYGLLVFDGPKGRTMFVDRNGDGRGEPNERVVMTRQTVRAEDLRPVNVYSGVVTLPGNAQYGTTSFVSDTRDSGYATVRDTLRLFPLSGFLGTAKIGALTYRIGVRGTDPATARLFIDRDGDGVLGTVPAESFALGKPFCLEGKSYRVSLFDPLRSTLAFAPSAVRVAEVPMPPDLRVGRIVPPVPGRTLTGKAVAFPKGFPGKLVLLDVWATWCGPCIAEIPSMRAAYAKYRKRGFEIVSMSIDDPGTQGRVAAFTKGHGMNWTQVFQGQGWKSPVCRRYNITSIPFMLLVDGTTGRIVGTEENLRGGRLDGTLSRLLSPRH